MPNEIDKFITATDNANDYSDDRLAKLEQARLEEIDNLMSNAQDRDEQLWDELDVDTTLTVKDFEEIDIEDRDIEWILGLSGITSASQTQFFLDEREETLIKPMAYRDQRMDGFDLTAAQLQIAGKRGVKFVPETEFVTLQAKYLDELSFLRDMDNANLYTALRDAKALKPFDQHVADSMRYVSRMTSYPENSEQWTQAVNDLIEKDSKRAMEIMNRRSVERLSVEKQIGGNLSALMAWIVEGGSATCSLCFARAGVILPYDEWQESGLPGEEVCLGGGYCRCHLHAVIQA
jgi:hypothetical protein